jgi:predicted TIM-barrel fold metal-dependent hydrolase
MRGDAVIFDLVCHVSNMLRDNWDEGRAGKIGQKTIHKHLNFYKKGIARTPTFEEFVTRQPSSKHTRDALFTEGSQLDYSMIQVVPLWELFTESPEAYIARCYELVELEPERIVFCGGTDPVIRGLDVALKDVALQATEMNARSMKFYTAHAYGKSWRMDDRDLAYPIYEKMLEHGITLAQVHKGDPVQMEPLNALKVDDLYQAAVDFPEMDFVIHHIAFPFEDEAVDLAARFPNVYVAMSTWINLLRVAPVLTGHRLGKALMWCGSDKILWGSETPLWPDVQKLIDLCWEFQIPEELQQGYGYPAITDADRIQMFGANLLRLLKMPYEPPVAGIPASERRPAA